MASDRTTPLNTLITQAEEQSQASAMHQTGDPRPEATQDIPMVMRQTEQVPIPNMVNSVPMQHFTQSQGGIQIPFLADMDDKTLKGLIVLIIIVAMTQNKSFQAGLVSMLPQLLKATEMVENVSVAVLAVVASYFAFKFIN